MADQKPKIGSGHASAMFRQGLRELRGAFYPESNVAQATEYGIYGTKTPGEVADGRQPAEQPVSRDQEPVKAAGTQRTPSDIAADARSVHGQRGQEAGNATVHGSPARTPSEIAADRSPHTQDRQPGLEQAYGL